MSKAQMGLAEIYRAYIACLNAQNWPQLSEYVAENVVHNDVELGLSGYQAMLENDFRAIPDLQFHIGLLVANVAFIAARLEFNCTPIGQLFGMKINGRKIAFNEHVFYEFSNGKIMKVHSIIDKAAIAAQI